MKSLSKKLFILLLSGITYSFAYGQTEPTDKLATRETRNLYLNLQTIAKKEYFSVIRKIFIVDMDGVLYPDVRI